MKFEVPSYKILELPVDNDTATELSSAELLIRQVEQAARTCYKSKTGEMATAKTMFKNLINKKHYAMLEFGNLIFRIEDKDLTDCLLAANGILPRCLYTDVRNEKFYEDRHEGNLKLTYTPLTVDPKKPPITNAACIVSGNLREWLEFFENFENTKIPNQYNIDLSDLKDAVGAATDYLLLDKPNHIRPRRKITQITDVTLLTDAERFIHERFTVRFIADRAFTHELVRMRRCSFAQESQRYVNYFIEKNGGNVPFIKPLFIKDPENLMLYDEIDMAEGSEFRKLLDKQDKSLRVFMKACVDAETAYMTLLYYGFKPEEARTVLPNNTRTEICCCANLEEWRHIFELRACDKTGPAHPQMKELMVPLLKEAKEKWKFAFGDLIPAEIEVK